MLLLSVLYFLSIQKVIPNFVYLIIALINSFYFFPIKLFLDKSLFTGPMKRKVIKVFSYFIISNIIVFSALLVLVVRFIFMDPYAESLNITNTLPLWIIIIPLV